MIGKTQILIADDHAMVRRGLKHILEEESWIEVVAECANGADALDWLDNNSCDLALIDIAMPHMNGIELFKQLHKGKPYLPVLILSGYAENQYALRLMKAGAWGYLTKGCEPREIIEAVRNLANGNKYFSKEVVKMLAMEASAVQENTPHEILSEREYEIFMLLASAKTVTEIANSFGLSVKTVSTYRTRILEKMRLGNNSELMHYVNTKNLAQHFPQSCEI